MKPSLKRYCGVIDQVTFSLRRESVPLTGSPLGLTVGVSVVDTNDAPGIVTELLMAASFSSRCHRNPVASDRRSPSFHTTSPNALT